MYFSIILPLVMCTNYTYVIIVIVIIIIIYCIVVAQSSVTYD